MRKRQHVGPVLGSILGEMHGMRVGRILRNSVSIRMMPVGSYPSGVSPYGCYDMACNAYDWCFDNGSHGGILILG